LLSFFLSGFLEGILGYSIYVYNAYVHINNILDIHAYKERQQFGPVEARGKNTKGTGKLPESTPSRETLAQVFQRGSLQDQLLDLHGYREDYIRVKVSA